MLTPSRLDPVANTFSRWSATWPGIMQWLSSPMNTVPTNTGSARQQRFWRSVLGAVLCGCIAAAVMLASSVSVVGGEVEAIAGKKYRVSRGEGPWMIMAMSLWGDTEEEIEKAVALADSVVLDLRKNKKIPAWVYAQQEKLEEVELPASVLATLNRAEGEDAPKVRRRKYRSQRSMVAILVGNFSEVDNAKAKRALTTVKGLRPGPLQKMEAQLIKEGAMAAVAETPSPFGKAFFTRNPLLSAEEVARRSKDPLVLRLNTGVLHSLAANPHKYSLTVASFYGRSSFSDNSIKPKVESSFDAKLRERPRLNECGEDATQLVIAMRQQGHEAYVWHDRYKSVVTVGGFDDINDPRIVELGEKYKAKLKQSSQTGKDELFAECIKLYGPDGQDPPVHMWILDPLPQLMETPRLNK